VRTDRRTHALIETNWIYTVSQKRSTFGLLYCNFEKWEWILIFFGRNVTDRVSNQKMYYYATSDNGETRKARIFTQILYQCIAWIQPAVWFLQSFWLATHTHNAVRLPKSCNQCVQPAGLLGVQRCMVQEKGSRERCRSCTVCDGALSSGFPIS